MSKLSFLKSKAFYKHFIIANVLGFAIIYGLILTLKFVTLHGEAIEVPDFKELKISDLDKAIQGIDIEYVIIDSIANISLPKGIVYEQDPPAGTKVKPGRKVYLTVNGNLTPKVAMPNLIDLSLRQASSLLKTYGLELGSISYVDGLPPVIDQKYKGRSIKPGEMIDKGSSINLVAGKGSDSQTQNMQIPDLFSLTFSQAKSRISSNGFTLGSVFYDDSVLDTLNAKVYKQSPDPDLEDFSNSNQAIDIYLTQSKDVLNNAAE